jgi:hypothetical protein
MIASQIYDPHRHVTLYPFDTTTMKNIVLTIFTPFLLSIPYCCGYVVVLPPNLSNEERMWRTVDPSKIRASDKVDSPLVSWNYMDSMQTELNPKMIRSGASSSLGESGDYMNEPFLKVDSSRLRWSTSTVAPLYIAKPFAWGHHPSQYIEGPLIHSHLLETKYTDQDRTFLFPTTNEVLHELKIPFLKGDVKAVLSEMERDMLDFQPPELQDTLSQSDLVHS